MSTDNLFPEQPNPKRKKRLQHQLLDYLRTGKIVTEEIYRKEIGGKSVSAVIHNIRMRGGFEKGESIVNEKVRDSDGFLTPGYRLMKEAHVDFPQKEQEIDHSGFAKGKDEDFATELVGWGDPGLEYAPAEEESPEPLDSVPEVSSIMVGVRGSQPELVIMFKGDFKPLRHGLSHMEVRYLLTNLEAFRPKRRED